MSSGQGRDAKPPITFSYLDFPNSASDCIGAVGCCASVVTPTMNYQAFDDVAYTCTSGPPSNACIQSDHRPIANALSRANDYFSLMPAAPHSNERFVLLVADGDPSGCSSSGPNGDCMDAITQIGNLTSLGTGVATEVLALGGNSAPNCLTELANCKQTMTPRPTTWCRCPTTSVSPYKRSPAPIAQAACHLTLSTASISASQLTVQFQGTPVMADFKNGWSLDNGGGAPRITLHGNACQNYILNYPFGLQISGGCASEHPNP